MIFQLDITIHWAYNDYVSVGVGGIVEATERFHGTRQQLEDYIKKYDGIELIRYPSERPHQPYHVVTHQVTVV